jgi:hypothetical protein
MTTIAQCPVNIQTSAESIPAIPAWFGEITLFTHHLTRQKILERISEQVRFARRRFGHYEIIDFVAVLFGYAVSGERTLEAFYQQLDPWASVFMALFGRDRLPARATLCRFLSSLDQATVETLRSLFLDDLLARPLVKDAQPDAGGLWDRQRNHFLVFDIDGTREAARQRALPKSEDLPPAFRRLDDVCAPGYTGRKRGEVVRTRTTILHAHAHQWLGSFGNPGNGQYRQELHRAKAVVERYLAVHQRQPSHALLRVDGQYGTRAVLADLTGFCFVTRGKDYAVLKQPEIQRRMHLPADQQFSRPESDLVRTLYDCPDLPPESDGSRLRVVVATHPATGKKSRIGLTRGGMVYELFFTNLPQQGFTASDVVALYLHRGAFEPALADEDREIDPDRWCSHSAWGQEAWQIISQWVWNTRLELGHHLEPAPVRTTEFAPALPSPSSPQAAAALSSGYAPPQVGLPWKAGRFSGQDFVLQPDGTLRCPADQKLVAHEQRREADGGLRMVYGASLRSCRPCPLREQCQWQGGATKKPRQVSILLHPLTVGTAPLFWRDWSRREHRRACMHLLRHQRVEVHCPPVVPPSPPVREPMLSRAQRAHTRLSWAERLMRNAAPPASLSLFIRLFGIPDAFAKAMALKTSEKGEVSQKTNDGSVSYIAEARGAVVASH